MTKSGGNSGFGEELELVEQHNHNTQIVFGNSAGVLTQGELTPFTLTGNAVANLYGAELQIYAGAAGAGISMDLDKIFVVTMDTNNCTYLIEFWAGSGVFGAASLVNQTLARSSTAAGRMSPLIAKSPRVRGDLNIWGRIKCSLAGAPTIDVLFETHQYPPPYGDEITS